MKKIILFFLLFQITAIVVAQSQSDLDKAKKQLEEAMKKLSPQDQAMMKQYMPSTIPNVKSTKPAAQNSGQAVNKPSELGAKITKVIGPEGGEIKTANGKIKLKFPAGALAKNTEITIEEIAAISDASSGNSFQLLPEGLQFKQPVKLTFKYDEQNLSESDAEDFTIITENNDGDFQFKLLAKIDTLTKTVSTDISHFSKWSLGSRSKIILAPKETTLNKGQSVDLAVQMSEMVPINAKGKEEIYKQIKEKEKQMQDQSINGGLNELELKDKMREIDWTRSNDDLDRYMQISARLENDTKSSEQEKAKIKAELKELKEKLGISVDDMATFLTQKKAIESAKFTVLNWKMNNVNAPVSNSFGTLTPNGLNAKYTAPKVIPMIRTINVIVTLSAKTKAGKQQKLILISKIVLIDQCFLNYTLDGQTTKMLQFGFSTEFIKNMTQNPQKGMEMPTITCGLDDEDILEIGGLSSLTASVDNKGSIDFKIKNPKMGQNLLKCDDSYRQNRNGAMVSIKTMSESEEFVNSSVSRVRNWDKTCSMKDVCEPFEINITELSLVGNGVVAGTFQGKVYEDNGPKKNCGNSIAHQLSGEFYLKFIIPVSENNFNPTKEKTSTEYDKPDSGTEPKPDEDLVPLVPPKTKTTPAKTTPKPKTKDAPIKAWE